MTNDLLRLTRDGRRLMVERLPDGQRVAAEFLSLTTLVVRDGSEIAATLDASGHAIELLRGRTHFTRK